MSLERCLAMVNSSLVKHNLLIALDDRGKISCHKVNLCFLYFNPKDCVAQLGKCLQRNQTRRPPMEKSLTGKRISGMRRVLTRWRWWWLGGTVSKLGAGGRGQRSCSFTMLKGGPKTIFGVD